MGRTVRWGAIAFLCLVGLLATFWPLLATGLRRMQTDPGDARHLNYILEHDYRWALSFPGHRDLWSPPDFYPERGTAAYSESLLGVAPFYVPFRLAGLPPDTSFQLWTLAMAAANFVCFFALLRVSLRLPALPSAAGAYLFAFGSIRAVAVGHQHLIPQLYTVGFLCALFQLFDGESRREAFALAAVGFFAVAQVYSSIYLGWLLGLASAAALVWALAFGDSRAALTGLVRRRWAVILGTAAGCALAVWPLAARYLEAARAVGYRSFDDVVKMVPRLASWVNLGPYSLLYGGLTGWGPITHLPLEWEHRLGLGLVTPLLCGLGLALAWRRPSVRLLALCGLTLVLLATRYPGGMTPWKSVFHLVPGARGLRAVTRVAFVVLPIASVGLALVIDRIVRRPRGWVLAATCAGIVVLEQVQRLPSFDKGEVRREVAALARRIPRDCRAFYYAPASWEKPPWETQLDAMWAGLESGIPTVNGYSSNLPRGWEPLYEARSDLPVHRERIERALESWMAAHGRGPAEVCRLEFPRSTLLSGE